jgi:uncharacterized protein
VTGPRPGATRPAVHRRGGGLCLPLALVLVVVFGPHPAARALDPAVEAKVQELLRNQEGVPPEWVAHDGYDQSLKPAAAMGDPVALYVVGRKYLIDAAESGSDEARRIGLEDLEWSARQAFDPADRFLGRIYLAGTGVDPDPARAIGYLERAAGRGDPIAQRRLGDLYFEGAQIPRDPSRALLWYGRVLANPATGSPGDPRWEVGLRVARLHLDGGMPEADPAEGRAVLERTAKVYPVGPVLKALAEAYARGLGGPARPRRAISTYDKAAADYLDRGLFLGIDPAQAHGEAEGILAAMERVAPGAAATRRLRLRLRGMAAAPVAPTDPPAP